MNIDVITEPQGEGERESWRFVFMPDSLRLRFTKYMKGSQLWIYPDLQGVSTIPQPQPPDVVLVEARQILLQKVTFEI